MPERCSVFSTSVGAVRELGDRPLARLYVPNLAQAQALEGGPRPYKVLDVLVGGVGEDALRGVVLGYDGLLAQDGYSIAHLYRLVYVVGDEDDGLLYLLLQPQELVLQPVAGDGVHGAERLVHEHDRGVRGHRAGHPDPLALATG